MARPAKPVPMCCVSIGYQNFLLPFADGMKLVALMQNAVTTQEHFGSGSRQYIVGDQPDVEFVAVKPNQVVMPSGAPRLENF